MKRYYDQTEFVAQQMVNILQNISQNREGDNKKITLDDIKRAASLACLSMYPGNTMYRNDAGSAHHDLSHCPRITIFYIKGQPGDRACCKWVRRFFSDGATIPTGWTVNNSTNSNVSKVTAYISSVSPSKIYPTLKIKNGEEKIIVETSVFNATNTMNVKDLMPTDNYKTCARKAFKFWSISPRPINPSPNETDTGAFYFSAVEIFTPAPGLFDGEKPPE